MTQSILMTPDPRGGWLIKRAGAAKDEGHFQSRADAEKFGRQLSSDLNADLEIHDVDGNVTREHPRRH